MKIDILMGFAEILVEDKDIKIASLGKEIVYRSKLFLNSSLY